VRVAGIMSGTSLDGIDVAIVDIKRGKVRTIAHTTTPYPSATRQRLLDVPLAVSAAGDLSRLNFELGELYAKAVASTCRGHKIPQNSIDLIGCHGQTIYHEGGKNTLQIGEAAVIAERLGIPVVSDFRTRDIAAGGQGAPLVPFADSLLFSSAKRNRVALNIGGIANITVLRTGIAFDTGPGNMVIDQLMQQLFAKPFDRGGKTGKRGTVLQTVVSTKLREAFFQARPPKTAGREQFGGEYTARFLEACSKADGTSEDAIASATALTAQSVALAYSNFLLNIMRHAPVDFIVSGGGARNQTLMQMLRQHLEPLGCAVQASDDLGLPAEAKEAAAFALLAYETWHRRPGNIPSATGAVRPAILGEITYV